MWGISGLTDKTIHFTRWALLIYSPNQMYYIKTQKAFQNNHKQIHIVAGIKYTVESPFHAYQKFNVSHHNPRGVTTTFPPIYVLSKSITPQTKLYTAHQCHYCYQLPYKSIFIYQQTVEIN
jgi:hypothetical protein